MRGGEGCRGGEKGGAGAKVCDDGVRPLVAGEKSGPRRQKGEAKKARGEKLEVGHSPCTSTLRPPGGSRTSTGADKKKGEDNTENESAHKRNSLNLIVATVENHLVVDEELRSDRQEAKGVDS